MQSFKFDEIIERTALKKGLNKQLLKSISDFVWKETKEEMYKFSNLRIYLKGFVAWYYGKKRLLDFREKVEYKVNAPNQVVENKKKMHFLESKDLSQLLEIRNKVDHLLQTYDVYIEDKRVTKTAYREEMQRLAEIRLNELNSKI